MQFLLGLLTAIVFFILLSFSFYLGYRFNHKRVKPPNPDEEEQRRARELHNDFMKLMNYNEDIALQRKKVTDK